MITLAQDDFPTYPEMIKRLFKLMPEGQYSSLMHAAVGMSGEAGELLCVNNRKNILEECGDLEFYMEAADQQMENHTQHEVIFDHRASNLQLGNVLQNIVTLTSDFLDGVKKAWVYGKSPDFDKLHSVMAMLRMNLDFLYSVIGTDFPEVLELNQIKLIGPEGRFRSGFYSDSEAVERNDKVGKPSNRSFIGQK
jgi:hypothetical protein